MANGKNGGERTLLLLQSSFCQSNNREYDGVFLRARELGLKVQVVQYGKASFNRFKAVSLFDRAWLQETLDFWKPDGCIVESGSLEYGFRLSAFGKMPVVFLDRHPSTVEKGAVCVISDAESVARAAARELMRLGFNHYAYFAFHAKTPWSEERGREFVRIAKGQGFDPLIFTACPSAGDSQSAVDRAVASLPRPCGVFAANDVVAEQVIESCQRQGISVPDEIAVVGVDDDEQICENASVSISSVVQDFKAAGRLAVDLIVDMIGHPRRSVKSELFRAVGVVRRASTRLACGDRRVIRGLEYIRLHACERMMVSQVVSAMGCSRRLADLLFGKIVGHTISEEINTVRIARACELLRRTTKTVAQISNLCGFSSDIVFRRIFKDDLGSSPREWRRQDCVACKVCI